MNIIDRILDYRRSHGTAYTLRRLGQKAAQELLGTYPFLSAQVPLMIATFILGSL